MDNASLAHAPRGAGGYPELLRMSRGGSEGVLYIRLVEAPAHMDKGPLATAAARLAAT